MHHLAGVGLGGAADDLSNQSLHGALLRFGLNGPLEITLFLLLGAAVGALGLRRANREHRDDQPQPDPDRAHRTTTVRAHFRFPPSMATYLTAEPQKSDVRPGRHPCVRRICMHYASRRLRHVMRASAPMVTFRPTSG